MKRLKLSKLPFLSSVVFASILLSPLCSLGDTINRVVAIVNDDVITLHELNKKIKEVTGLAPEDLRFKDENGYLQTRRMILEHLINARIAREKIEELGIKVTPQEVDSAIERIKKDNQWTHEDLLYHLEKVGLTYEEYKKEVQKDLERYSLINREVKSKILIREEEIKEYYEANRSKYETRGEVHLAGIFLVAKDATDEKEMREVQEKGEEILARIRKGEDFSQLARDFSQGPGAQEGGDLGQFQASQLEPEIVKVIESLKEGETSPLIIRPNGVQIIKLIQNQKSEVKSFESVRNAIYTLLFKEEVNRRYNDWIKELRERSYTKIIF